MTPPTDASAYGAAERKAVGCTSRRISLSAWVSGLMSQRHGSEPGKTEAADLGSSSTSTGKREPCR